MKERFSLGINGILENRIQAIIKELSEIKNCYSEESTEYIAISSAISELSIII
jgi:hypothetical protein